MIIKKLQEHFSIKFLLYTALIIILMMPVFYYVTVYHFGEEFLELEQSVRDGHVIERGDIISDIGEGLILIYIIIFSTLLISFFIMQRFISESMMQPFYDTLNKIKRYSIEKEEKIYFGNSNIKEFNELNSILETFVKNSRDSFDKQKELIHNISHEYQTPISVLQIKLDRLLEMNNLPIEAVGEIEDMYKVINKSRLMNRNLLLLAKVDNNQFEINEEIRLIHFIKESIVPQIELVYPESILIFDYKDDISVKANSILLTSAIKNLLINAIKHSVGSEPIHIYLQSKSLQIVNSCSKDSALDKELIFSRFYKTKNSNGCGFGLPIVKSICDAHNWSIDYIHEEANHIFEIKF